MHIGGGRDGVSGDFAIGWGQSRLPEFVWQLAIATDHGPHPIASPWPLKTPHPEARRGRPAQGVLVKHPGGV